MKLIDFFAVSGLAATFVAALGLIMANHERIQWWATSPWGF